MVVVQQREVIPEQPPCSGRVARAAHVVVDRLQRDLDGTGVVVAITLDAASALVDPTHVSAPVVDCRTGQRLGALTLSSDTESSARLLDVVARYGAREIEQRLDGRHVRDSIMQEAFLLARRRTRGPLVLVSDDLLLCNARAVRLFDETDRLSLWSAARAAVRASEADVIHLPSRNGAWVRATVTPLHDDDGHMTAALLHIRRTDETSPADPAHAVGWPSLTDTERGIVDLAAEGLSNREIGARLFLSRHTVDSHLRRIFQKVGVHSRVELAALAAARLGDAPVNINEAS